MKKKILIIDDDPDIVCYLEATFKDAGYETLAAFDAAEALEKVRNENPDLITLDIDMPGRSGTMFYITLRKDTKAKGIPVIVVSGVGPRPPSLRKDIPTVTKPIDQEHLLSLVAENLSQ